MATYITYNFMSLGGLLLGFYKNTF